MTHTYGQSGTQTFSQTATQTHAPTQGQAYGQSQAQAYGHTAAQQHGQGHGPYVLDDRDILTDLLLCQKQLLSAYGTATTECTNPQLRQTLKQISNTEADFHTNTFELMRQRGWYETPHSDVQLARQISSLWTQKMQRSANNEAAFQHQNQQSFGSGGQQWQQPQGSGQAQTQGWQPGQGGGQPWQQQGWTGQGAHAGSPSNSGWQAGQAAARTWDASESASDAHRRSVSPGAHT